jgi:polyhydroxybutyrate depolymerase
VRSRPAPRTLLVALGIGAGLIGCSDGGAPPGDSPQLGAGDHQFTIRHGNRNRSYIVHVPPAATSPLPVVLAFHGGGGNAAGFQDYSELDEVADSARFIVVYPNGTGPLPNQLLTWNAGDGCCGYALEQNVDDVGFAVAVVDDLADRTPIHRGRIYATGHSNGAILSHRIAAERPGFVAAIAPVAGSLDLAQFAPSSPVPVLQIHSVDDPRALYNGGLGPPFPGTNNQVFHQPVQAGLDRWRAANFCIGDADTLAMRQGAPGTDDATHTAVQLLWHPCRNAREVMHWKLTVAGHGWPGDEPPATPEFLSGPHTSIINAAREIWRFVSRFTY